jgi:hypothetical protein
MEAGSRRCRGGSREPRGRIDAHQVGEPYADPRRLARDLAERASFDLSISPFGQY